MAAYIIWSTNINRVWYEQPEIDIDVWLLRYNGVYCKKPDNAPDRIEFENECDALFFALKYGITC